MRAKGAILGPNSSIAIRVQVTGVLEAPAKSETKPSAAKSGSGTGRKAASALPKVTPIKTKGVNSPPLKVAAIANVVKSSFSKGTDNETGSSIAV